MLDRRRYVYRNRLRACYIGSNPYSQYRPLRPAAVQQRLLSKARAFIRRELAVFPFLSGADVRTPVTTSRQIEFVTAYTLALLRLVDTETVSGARAAAGLLGDYLGQHTALFLHELRAFLRSPFETVAQYDRVVQYRTGRGDGTPLADVSAATVAANLRALGADPVAAGPRRTRER
ncbi:uncharacterized protein V1510DRAFT_409070 [Dipodascopsis tothii]|uniref:uncharacterized protein n=1 Tax=Dipodascopsis tothii TaxID=44089 RepID=UPI0034CD3FAD